MASDRPNDGDGNEYDDTGDSGFVINLHEIIAYVAAYKGFSKENLEMLFNLIKTMRIHRGPFNETTCCSPTASVVNKLFAKELQSIAEHSTLCPDFTKNTDYVCLANKISILTRARRPRDVLVNAACDALLWFNAQLAFRFNILNADDRQSRAEFIGILDRLLASELNSIADTHKKYGKDCTSDAGRPMFTMEHILRVPINYGYINKYLIQDEDEKTKNLEILEWYANSS